MTTRRWNSKPATAPVEVSLAGQPLVLVAGILGAGKTTLLRSLLPELSARDVRARVFINDYQNASVDAATLAHLAAEVTAISGSCVCCDSGEELFDALAKAAGRTGEVLLVETNGTTDTMELLTKLAADGRTRGLCLLQVSLVDCERWQADHWQQELEASQLHTASHVVFSRAKRVSQHRREAVTSAVRMLNGRAVETSPKRLANQLRLLTTRRRWLIPRTLRDHRFSARRDTAGPNAGHTHAALAHAFTSVELRLPRGLTEPQLRAWLSALPAEVLRVKGITRLRGEPGVCCGFQRVGPFADLARYPASNALRLGSRAILIGPNLDAPALCRQAERALAPEQAMPARRSARPG